MKQFMVLVALFISLSLQAQIPQGEISSEAPKYPDRPWLVGYVVTQWESPILAGSVTINSQFGNPGVAYSVLFTDLIKTLTNDGTLDGISGFGQYRTKGGRKIFKANVYMTSYDYAPPGFSYKF